MAYTGDQATDELVADFEPAQLAEMYLEASRKHESVRARLDEHAAEIVALREAPPDPLGTTLTTIHVDAEGPYVRIERMPVSGAEGERVVVVVRRDET